MISRISAQNNTNFQGAVKVKGSSKKLKGLRETSQALFAPNNIIGRLDAWHSDGNKGVRLNREQYMTYYFANRGDEIGFVSHLKKEKIPFIHNQTPNLTANDAYSFHHNVTFPKEL